MRRVLFGLAAACCVAGTASAADLSSPRGPVMAVAPVGFNWTGFYIGGHLGIASVAGGYDAFTPRNGFAGFPLQGMGGSALMGGMQIGYNYQLNNLVLGLEADLSAVGFNKSSTTALAPAAGVVPVFARSLNWTATFAPRIGVTFDRAMLYAKAGLALGGFTTGHDQGPYLSSSSTRAGWMVGAGLEYAVTQNLTAKIEYNYLAFGRFRTDLTGAPNIWIQQRGDVHAVKVGVNYLFSSGPAGVVARY
ncbi:outer membrane protein [Phreatobacter oligotrophus]|jgi:outer membrane immunogenic protein|uniref:outer membrane protein n=1 Tax=Phreatobacter oligotrophus TaxID=1122261 RepID=UPI002356D7CC|nr:outer membrane protein [Phreatobacter oligotrophus]MBX9990567.1 porin family protein [Phreatobacter oligotrophus]